MAIIKTGKTNAVVVESKEFQGKNYIDVRNYYQDDEGEYKPTAKGVMISHDKVLEVYKELRKVLLEQGILKPKS